jgi:hypothetical protein
VSAPVSMVIPKFPIAKLVMEGPASKNLSFRLWFWAIPENLIPPNSKTQPGATPGCLALMCLCQLSRLLLEKEHPGTPMAEQAYTDGADAKSCGCLAFS